MSEEDPSKYRARTSSHESVRRFSQDSYPVDDGSDMSETASQPGRPPMLKDMAPHIRTSHDGWQSDVTPQNQENDMLQQDRNIHAEWEQHFETKLRDNGFVIIRLLGYGIHGDVFEVVPTTSSSTNSPTYALKVFRNREVHYVERRLREMDINIALAKRKHPHLVATIDRGALGPFDYIKMEMCTMSLREWLLRPKLPRLTLIEGIYLTAQVLSGLSCLHTAGFLHRDLTPDNVFLVGSDKFEGSKWARDLNPAEWTIKLGDFGLAALSNEAGNTKRPRETPFADPGLKKSPEFKSHHDMWAAGAVILCTLLKHTWPATKFVSRGQVAKAVTEGGYQRELRKGGVLEIYEPLAPLVESFFFVDPAKRPTAKAALERLQGILDEQEVGPDDEDLVARTTDTITAALDQAEAYSRLTETEQAAALIDLACDFSNDKRLSQHFPEALRFHEIATDLWRKHMEPLSQAERDQHMTPKKQRWYYYVTCLTAYTYAQECRAALLDDQGYIPIDDANGEMTTDLIEKYHAKALEYLQKAHAATLRIENEYVRASVLASHNNMEALVRLEIAHYLYMENNPGEADQRLDEGLSILTDSLRNIETLLSSENEGMPSSTRAALNRTKFQHHRNRYLLSYEKCTNSSGGIEDAQDDLIQEAVNGYEAILEYNQRLDRNNDTQTTRMRPIDQFESLYRVVQIYTESKMYTEALKYVKVVEDHGLNMYSVGPARFIRLRFLQWQCVTALTYDSEASDYTGAESAVDIAHHLISLYEAHYPVESGELMQLGRHHFWKADCKKQLAIIQKSALANDSKNGRLLARVTEFLKGIENNRVPQLYSRQQKGRAAEGKGQVL